MLPVVTHGVVTDLKRLRLLLRTHDIHNVYFKFIKTSNLIFSDSQTSYNKLLQYMKTQGMADEEALTAQFHIYRPATQKPNDYVICGLD